MKRLFTEDNREDWTPEALMYDKMITDALSPIFDLAKKNVHSIRDIYTITNMVALDLSLYNLMEERK